MASRGLHVARTFGRVGVSEITGAIGFRRSTSEDEGGASKARARAIRRAFEELGPFWVKMGQMLASRPDVVSEEMIAEFENLHEQVSVRPFDEFVPALELSMGPQWRKYFAHIDTDQPVGAASLAQVYTAELRDGRKAVVKVQRPGVEQVVLADIRFMSRATAMIGRLAPELADIFEFDAMADSLFSAMKPEIDFRLEADNMEEFRPIVRPYSHVAIPDVLFSSKQVLVQSRAPGKSIRHANHDEFSSAERSKIANQLLACNYRSMLIEGLFHADPHPGNVFVAPGEPAYMIDFGMMGRLDRTVSAGILKMMIAMGRRDAIAAGRAIIDMGRLTHRADVKGYLGDMQRILPASTGGTIADADMGQQMGGMIAACRRRGVAPPSSIALLGKAMSNIQGSVAFLAPELDSMSIIVDVFGAILKEATRQQMSGQELMSSGLASLELQRMLPDTLRTILDNLANGQLTVRTVEDTTAFSQREDRADDRQRSMRRWAIAAGAFYLWDRRQRGAPVLPTGGPQ